MKDGNILKCAVEASNTYRYSRWYL